MDHNSATTIYRGFNDADNAAMETGALEACWTTSATSARCARLRTGACSALARWLSRDGIDLSAPMWRRREPPAEQPSLRSRVTLVTARPAMPVEGRFS
jgi:hypothetical protein